VLNARLFMSFVTQKREIIREGTQRALKLRWWFCLLCPHKVRDAETFMVFKRNIFNLLMILSFLFVN